MNYRSPLKNNFNGDYRNGALVRNHATNYPSPSNLSYFWNFGFAAFVFLLIQILTGIFLSMHYCSDMDMAFSSVQHIMRDVNYGWLMRYMHSNGASFFFIVVYLHIARGMYYQRFDFFNLKVWVTGIIIFFLMMATAFIGYVLPWGQMSFWGATVITNLVSAIPLAGDSIVYWLWGGYSVDNPTLSRFFTLHFVLPFVILAVALLHMALLHEKGSSNPSFVSDRINKHYLPLYPYFVLKDLVGLFIILFFYFYMVFFYPNFLGHTDNFIEANPMVTPEHIVPEWYFLPFYAILRSIPNKLLGVLAMVVSILIFLLIPYLSFVINHYGYSFKVSPTFNRYIYPALCFIFFTIFILLGWIGSQPAEEPYILLGSILLKFYFLFIFVNCFLIYFIKNK